MRAARRPVGDAQRDENKQLSRQCWMYEQEIGDLKRAMLLLEEHASMKKEAKEKRERAITPIPYDKLKILSENLLCFFLQPAIWED